MATIRERMQEYLNLKGITDYRLEKDLGKSKGYWGKTKNPTAEFIAAFVLLYSDISAEWLVRGTGSMYLEDAHAGAITGANKVTGDNATVIGQQSVTLSEDFVRGMIAEKDKQINTLLNLLASK